MHGDPTRFQKGKTAHSTRSHETRSPPSRLLEGLKDCRIDVRQSPAIPFWIQEVCSEVDDRSQVATSMPIPISIRLAPGARGEIIWTFANAAEFGFACLVPRHYDSGTTGGITVAN